MTTRRRGLVLVAAVASSASHCTEPTSSSGASSNTSTGASAPARAASAWTRFEPDGEPFSVLSPGRMDRRPDPKGGWMYGVPLHERSAFSVTCAKFSSPTADKKAELAAFVKTIMKGAEHEKQAPIVVEGVEGIEATSIREAGEMDHDFVVRFLPGKTSMCAFQTVVPEKFDGTADVRRFLESARMRE